MSKDTHSDHMADAARYTAFEMQDFSNATQLALDPQLKSLQTIWVHRSLSHLNTMLKDRIVREHYEQCTVIRNIIIDKLCQPLLRILQPV